VRRDSHALRFERNPPYKAYLETAFALGIWGADLDLRNLLSRYYVNLAAPVATAATLPGACQLFIMPWNTLQRFCEGGYLSATLPGFDLRRTDPQEAIAWVIGALEAGAYVYATVNEFFLPGTRAHAAGVHYTHPSLITACDGDAQTFSACTYLADGTYGSTSVSYTGWAQAFTQRGDRDRMPDAHFHDPVLKGITRSRTPYSLEVFDRLAVANAVANYVHCRFEKYERYDREIYGVDAARVFLERIAAAAGAGEAIDLRGTRTLMEHRAILVLVLEHAQRELALRETARIERALSALATWTRTLHSLAYDYERERAAAGGPAHRLLRHLRDADRMSRLDRRSAMDLVGALEPMAGSIS